MLEFYISISDIASTKVMATLVTLLSFYLYFIKKNLEAGVVLVSSSLAMIFTYSLKYILQVPRPVDMLISAGDYRFPSGHATMAAVLATLVISFTNMHIKSKSLRLTLYIFAILWCALVSYSRIYLGVHYLIDILAGIMIGVLSVIMVVKYKLKK